MTALRDLHNAIVDRVARLGPPLMPSLARLIFAGTLFVYFWNSAKTKLSGPFTLDFGAYAQIFPRKFDAVGYDPSAMSGFDNLVIFLGTYTEFALPVLIVIGLLTRLSAIGMIGFIIVQSLTDIVGHKADAATIGSWFDKASDALIVDQRAFWVFLLLVLVFRGAGPLSVDRVLRLN